MSSLAELRSTFAIPGRLVWIGLRPGQGRPMQAVLAAQALEGRGLEGDRKAQRSGGQRQVTRVERWARRLRDRST
jgi:hypothetical protein